MKLSERPLELCFVCDEPTGRAGKGEDSLYCDECDKGPYCPECFRKHHESDTKVAQLERVATAAKELVEKMDGVSCVGGYFVDDIREALKEVEHLLSQSGGG